MPHHKKFIFVKKTITTINYVIPENAIGIVEKELNNSCLILFVDIDNPVEILITDFEFFDIKNTGDSFEKKVCNVCHKLLNTIEFSKNQNGVNNRSIRRPSCGECRKVIDGVSLTSSEKKKWAQLKPNLEIFECPICLKRTIPGLTSKVVLDHDHSNGKARGWICDSCNTGIGRFKDDIWLLKQAIRFLETN